MSTLPKIPGLEAKTIGRLVKAISYARTETDGDEIDTDKSVSVVGVLRSYSIDTVERSFNLAFDGGLSLTVHYPKALLEIYEER